MAQAVIFPKLGQTMEEGAIVKWLKKEGDAVAKGDILFEIETDKANLEVESFFEGVLLKIYVREGITVPVNTVVGYIGAAGEKVPDQPPAPVPAARRGISRHNSKPRASSSCRRACASTGCSRASSDAPRRSRQPSRPSSPHPRRHRPNVW